MSTSHFAQVKEEYLRSYQQSNSPQTSDKSEHVDTEPASKKQKRGERGQNKSRAKKNKIQYTVTLCPDLAKGHECKFAAQKKKPCRFSHDIQQYLSSVKPKDIGSRCIFYEALGHCPQGYLCRFGNAHIDKDGKLMTKKHVQTDKQPSDTAANDDETEEKKQQYTMTDDLNLVSSKEAKTLSRLKPNDLSAFPITKQLMSYFKQFDSVYHPHKRRKLYIQNKAGVTNNDTKCEEDSHVIKASDDYKLQNVYKFVNKQETEATLQQLFNERQDDSIPNYYASLNLIDLEPRKFDVKNKLYLAPLTTVGNLPFRRICVEYGADITCGEMAMATNMLKGMRGEWALCRRHATERVFGLQLAAGYVDSMCKVLEYMHHVLDFRYDFIDLNVGCPLDEINNKRSGAALMKTPYHLRTILRGMHSITNANKSVHSKGAVAITCKMRKGFMHQEANAKEIINVLCHDGVSAIGVHGRSRQQRYRRPADWEYIKQCVQVLDSDENKAYREKVNIIGNGDVFNWNEWYECMEKSACDTIMIGRGALIKPWIFTEIKQKKALDISSTERFEIIRKFTNYGLERWGSDQRGVDNTRRFLLEWLSFLCRYIPVGILEKPVTIHQGVPNASYYVGRNELETLMASKNVNDWVKITEMVLGPVGDSNFTFVPKHKASSYAPSIIDDKNYILNELGEIMKTSNETETETNTTNSTGVSGHKRKLTDV